MDSPRNRKIYHINIRFQKKGCVTMKVRKQALIVVILNGKERMAVSYGMVPGMDIRKRCHEIVDLIRDTKDVKDAVSLLTADVLRRSGYVYGMSEKARQAEREELRRMYRVTFGSRQEFLHENGLLMFRKETIQQAKKTCDVLAEISCDVGNFTGTVPGMDW